jgi:hypothetical protein
MARLITSAVILITAVVKNIKMTLKTGLDKRPAWRSYAQKSRVGNFLNYFSAYGIDFASR